MILLKSKEELACIREAGAILSSIVKTLAGSLKVGMTTFEMDTLAEDLMAKAHVRPAFKGYRGFPASICISINNEVVHGIPSKKRRICDGDVVSIDTGILHKEFYADMAVTCGVGRVDPGLKRLMEVTKESLFRGIAQAVSGNHLSDISFAIQSYVESQGFSVVRDFVGHGIGRSLHEDPEVPNFGLPHNGPILKEGMVLAIEPMVNKGSWETQILEDGWTVVTKDGEPSAHFEHTVAITKKGPEVLTI